MTDLDVATAAVTAALKNADGTQNIYITTDPTVNALTVTISNVQDHDIVFPAGTPACDERLPSGQSAIYFYFGGFLDNADIAVIPLTAKGWTKGTFTGSDSLQYLVIAPDKQVKLPPGDTLTFQLGHVVLAHGKPGSGNGSIWLNGATGVTPLQSQVQLYLNVANPPQPGKRTLDVDVDINFDDPAEVYTGKPQQLTLHLINTLQTALVPGGTPFWNGVTPEFQLTLVYGDKAGALTSVADAANIVVNPFDEYGNVWQPPERDGQSTSPYWILRPDPNGGGTVLGTGQQGAAAIEFAVTGIKATLPAGLDHAISVAYLSWRNVPGYNDGSKALAIMKRASMQVLSFSTIPSQIDYNQEITLDWRAVGGDGVYLVTNHDQANRRYLGGLVPDPDHPAKLTPVYGTTYELYCFKNPIPMISDPFQLTVTFNPIVINKFEAHPAGVASHQSTTVSWDVQHAMKISYQGRDVTHTPNSSSVETPASDTTYNLVATWVDGSQVPATPVHVTVVPVQLDGYPSWTGDFTGSGRSQLLCCSSGQNLGLGTATGTSIGWALAGTAPSGVSPQSIVTWVGDFTGDGRAQIMSYSPGDRTWRLGTFTGTSISWTQIHWRMAEDVLIQNGRTWVADLFNPYAQVLAYSPGNGQFWCGGLAGGPAGDAPNDELLLDSPPLSLTGYAQSDPTWAADFTGSGWSQILFCSPGSQRWWLGAVWLPIPPTINWTHVGDTATTACRYDPSDPTWVADFTGSGKSQILFCSKQSWWLGSFTGGEYVWSPAPALGWAQVSDTTNFGYDPSNHPTWVADFTSAGKSQVLFCFTGDQHWWLATYNGTRLAFDWAEVSDTSKTTFHYDLGDPTWVGDFTAAGKSQILFYSRHDQNWYLGTYTGPGLSWTQVA